VRASQPDLVGIAGRKRRLTGECTRHNSRLESGWMLDVLHRANPRLIGLDLQFISASPHPAQDRALLSAFARDGPVLVSVSDTGAEVPTIVCVRNPAGVVPASSAVDADSDGVLRN
jgi:CHASE2 domain-containing sensor protein